MPTWPSSLPTCPLLDGYSEQPKSQVLRSKMDAGPPKSRRRYTAGVRTLPVRMVMSSSQVDEFEAWFEDVIQAGSLPFDFQQPRTEELVSVMIVGDPPYQLTPLGGKQYWTVAMQLEIQP